MRTRLQTLATSGLSLAVILALQVVGLPNLLTGIAVNAVLIFAVGFIGWRYAAIIGLLSPVGGFLSGHVPAVMYPVIPVIMVGNLCFIVVYSRSQKMFWLPRLLLPAVIKALLIFLIGMAVINWLEIAEKVKWLIVPVLGIQFLTALAGIFLGEKLLEQLKPYDQAASGS